MAAGSLSELIGVGLYTVSEASRLTGVPSGSIKRWMFGYEYKYNNEKRTQSSVVRSQLADIRGKAKLISFRDLIEVMFVHEFHKQGVSWKTIRMTSEKARTIVCNSHPFSTHKFLTDGRGIFGDIAVNSKERALVNLASDQTLFRSVMLPGLREALEFKGQEIARWWPKGKKVPVVLDPSIQFGRPVTEEEGVPTEVLAKAFEALGNVKRVARWYDVSVKSVKASIEFERRAA